MQKIHFLKISITVYIMNLMLLFYIWPINKASYFPTFTKEDVVSVILNKPEYNVTAVQRHRQQRIKEVCDKYNLSRVYQNNSNMYLLADLGGRFLFCNNYKVASTNWRRVLTLINGRLSSKRLINWMERFNITHDQTGRFFHNPKIAHAGKFSNLYKLRKAIQRRTLNTGFKFTCVRDPYERLLSAWRDKFMLNDSYNEGYHKIYGTAILRKYRKNVTEEELKTGYGVRFSEFLQYVIDEAKEGVFDPHWSPYYKNCMPCAIHYDVIAHLETITNDAPVIIRKLSDHSQISTIMGMLPGKENGPSAKQWNSNKTTLSIMEEYYRHVSRDILEGVRQVYDIDLKMFDYNERLF